MLAAAVTAAYGLFLAVGGVIGFLKARSVASLIAGLGCGLIALVCAALMDTPARGRPAATVMVVLAALLGARFAAVWWQKRRVMPELATVLFSLAIIIVVSAQLVSR